MFSKADQPDAFPHIHRLAQPVSPLGNEDYAIAGRLLHAIDRLLQRVRVIRDAIRLHAKIVLSQIHRIRVIGRSG